jgi:hypothetical protein
MTLDTLRKDASIKQKKGIHFILTSILLWTLVLIIHLSNLPILTKNFYTFIATTPLMPIAYLLSKPLKIEFTHKENPLTSLGFLFSLNQLLYLLIAMWVYNANPDYMVMVLAMIFGAHLLPYSWLYQSVSYKIMAIIIPILVLIIGITFEPFMVALVMVVAEIIFSVMLGIEIKRLSKA